MWSQWTPTTSSSGLHGMVARKLNVKSLLNNSKNWFSLGTEMTEWLIFRRDKRVISKYLLIITNLIGNLDLMVDCKCRSLLIIQQLQCRTRLISKPIRRIFVWRDRQLSRSLSFLSKPVSLLWLLLSNVSLSALTPSSPPISPFSPLISLSPSFPNSL